MDELDKKIKLILSKDLKLPDDYNKKVKFCIDNLNEYSSKKNIFRINRIIQIFKFAIVGILTSGVIAFAYNEIQKFENSKVNQTISNVNDNIEINTFYDDNGIKRYEYSIKYPFNADNWEKTGIDKFLKITNISEYNKYKEEYANIFEMEEMIEDDFKNNFILLIKTFGDVYVDDINAIDKTLYIDIIRNFNDGMEEKKVISLKLSKELERENLKISYFPAEDVYSLKPSIKELLKNNFTKEEALKNNWIVTEYNKDECKDYIISNNIDNLNEFVEKTKNGNEMEIRLVEFRMISIYFCDIKYENGIYKLYTYVKYLENSGYSDEQDFRIGKDIQVNYLDESKTYMYSLVENSTVYIGDIERKGNNIYKIFFEYNVR